MKKVLLLVSCLSVGFIIACGGYKDSDSSVNPFRENIDPIYKTNLWESGLVDHVVRNLEVPDWERVKFSDLYSISYSSVAFESNHFRLSNTRGNLLFDIIKKNAANIDGIFVGVVDLGTLIRNENLIISLVNVNQTFNPLTKVCTGEKSTFYRINGKTINFKCINKDTGVWAQIDDTDPLMVTFNKKNRGIFIGKNNLFSHILNSTRTSMYLYTGLLGTNRHFVAVDKPYFSNLGVIGSGGSAIPPAPTNPVYLSTLKGFQVYGCESSAFFYTNHGTIRPCPNNCPE
jgi:hypothetical protein